MAGMEVVGHGERSSIIFYYSLNREINGYLPIR
jgi:hypothetical protein